MRLLAFLAIACAAAAQGLSPVSLDDWVDPAIDGWEYRAIERFHSLGLVSDVSMNTRPFTRETVGRVAAGVRDRVHSGEVVLSAFDRRRLDWLLEDYADVLPGASPGADRRSYWPHAVLRSREGFARFGGQAYAQMYSLNSDALDDVSGVHWRTEIRLEAGWGDTWSLHERFAFDRFTDDLTYDDPPRRGLAAREWRGILGNVDEATITGRVPWGRIWAGRDRVKWGAGARGSMLISHNAPPLDLLAAQVDVGRFTFAAFTALLDAETPRWLAAHRLSFDLWRGRAEVGVAEAAYYAERGLDFRYIVPIIPYYAIQWSDSSNKDNLLLSVDGRVVPARGLALYGEIVVDDFQIDTRDRGKGGDKLGLTAGVHIVDPFGLHGTELRAEYVRVNTATYTHYNGTTNAQHEGWPVGHWLGPDGDDVYVSASGAVGACVLVAAWVDRMRRGEADVLDTLAYLPGDAGFPSGVVEKTTTFGLEVRYRPAERAEAYARASHSSFDNAANVSGAGDARTSFWAGARIGF